MWECSRAKPIASSLAAINCQNVPHNSARANRPLVALARLYLKLTRPIDSRWECAFSGRDIFTGPSIIGPQMRRQLEAIAGRGSEHMVLLEMGPVRGRQRDE